MGPNVQTIDQQNRATPLANDWLSILRGQLSEGAFGTGVGPLQRQAGKAGQQYLESRQNQPGINTAGQVGDFTNQLISTLTKQSNVGTNRQAADLREGFGAFGNRFGSSIAQGESGLRGDASMNLDALIAQILTAQGDRQQGARQFDVGANQNANSQLLQAIMGLQGMGEQNLAPYNAFASQGILNPEQIVTPGWGSQLLNAATTIGAAYLGKAPAIGGTQTIGQPAIQRKVGTGTVGDISTYPGSYTSGQPVVDPRIFDQYLMGG